MRTAAVLLSLVLLAACSDSTGEDGSRCEQTHGFGNSGCADLTGTVVDPAGAPVRGARVVAHAPETRLVALAGGIAQTDAEGRFRLRVLRMAGTPTTPDTVTAWVRAARPFTGGEPSPRDSVAVVLDISPVGAPATIAQIPTLVLPAP
jgi:hypothetical protein